MFGVVAFVAGVGVVSFVTFESWNTGRTIGSEQSALDPFYTPPAELPDSPGVIIRSEPLGTDVDNGTGYRILYTSLDSANQVVAVGGMVFLPSTPAPAGGRKVVAWAHPTVGVEPQCAPSRNSNPLQDTQTWLPAMLAQNYVVTATDYYGLGTPGPLTYLIGQQEAKDVAYSVVAAGTLPDASTSQDWAVWGHSQGGHSALWTAALAERLIPDYNLVAAGAAAPAEQLTSIVEQQWNQVVGWVIGVEAVNSFQAAYPEFSLLDDLTTAGHDFMGFVNSKCIIGAALESQVLEETVGQFFASNPLEDPEWVAVVDQQTPPNPPNGLPIYLSEGTKDTVVLSGTNAQLQVEWCAAGVPMTVDWLGNVGHMQVALASGPSFVQWVSEQFQGNPPKPNCDFPPAYPPTEPPTIDPSVQQRADELKQQYPLPPLPEPLRTTSRP